MRLLPLVRRSKTRELELRWAEEWTERAMLTLRVQLVTDLLRQVHQPIDQEVELYCDYPDDADHPQLPDECDNAGTLGCVGHIVTEPCCQECGYDWDGDTLFLRPWPCPTIRALTELATRPETT